MHRSDLRQPPRRNRHRFLCAALAAPLLVLAACTYRGASDNSVVRRFTWFSYLNGDDIRAACRAGARERYRFVYNAQYTKHVRTYDLVGSPWRDGNTLEVRVLTEPDFAEGVKLTDPLEAWRGKTALAQVSDVELALIKETLAASGFGGPPPAGLKLPSRGYYWVVSACRAGRFAFDAWLHPSERFQGLRFPAELARVDTTEVPTRAPPPPGTPDEPRSWDPRDEGRPIDFELVITTEGVASFGIRF